MTTSQWLGSIFSARFPSNTRTSTSDPTPPYPDLQPTVEWQVNGLCNYDCIYCIQSRPMRVGIPEPHVVSAIVRGLAHLPGKWEVKMSGGEPFAFKGFVSQVIPELVTQTRHWISVLTNFSAPRDVLREFCQLTGERLRITSASLHPDTADVGEFLAKGIDYRAFRADHNPQSSFVINVVLVPGKVVNHFAYREQIESHGFRYFPQLMKIKGGVFPYEPAEMALIEKLTGGSLDPRQVNRAPSYRGLLCEAGAWYFIVDQTGEAYTCRTGKRFAPKRDRQLPSIEEDSFDSDDKVEMERGTLGSFVRGDFRLRPRGGLCPYPICPCTVPANRGIIRFPLGERVQLSDGGHDDAG